MMRVLRRSNYLFNVKVPTKILPSIKIKNTLSPSHTVNLKDHMNNLGANRFMGRVYATTGLGICTGLSTAQAISYTGLALTNPLACLGIGTIVSFGSLAGIYFSNKEIRRHEDGYLYSKQSPSRYISFATLCVGMGMTLAPMLPLVPATAFPLATVASLGTMGTAALYAYLKDKDHLASWKCPLIACLGGLVSVSLISLGSLLIFGPNPFSAAFFAFDTYFGIGLFSALTAYDTYAAVKMYEEGNPDHLECGTNFFLNFMNLFVRFLEIFSKFMPSD